MAQWEKDEETMGQREAQWGNSGRDDGGYNGMTLWEAVHGHWGEQWENNSGTMARQWGNNEGEMEEQFREMGVTM